MLSCTACTKFQNPLIGEHGPTLDEALIGRWTGSSDQGRVELTISRRDGAGHLLAVITEDGQAPEADEARLITARLERQTFASIHGGENGRESWTLTRYELHPPDRLSIYRDNGLFWEGAIRNKIVSGEFSVNSQIRSATVTASSEELRAVVLGYGGVIFEDTPVLELTRN